MRLSRKDKEFFSPYCPEKRFWQCHCPGSGRSESGPITNLFAAPGSFFAICRLHGPGCLLRFSRDPFRPTRHGQPADPSGRQMGSTDPKRWRRNGVVRPVDATRMTLLSSCGEKTVYHATTQPCLIRPRWTKVRNTCRSQAHGCSRPIGRRCLPPRPLPMSRDAAVFRTTAPHTRCTGTLSADLRWLPTHRPTTKRIPGRSR